ncbi:MAG: hypothetical protein A2293_08020 [Elusimicrobia bacterium RIFOXYB2_FULL_49_7]|nr:MAG: hypothetical protein A2293_08020 [Elusimicrobia bacterium RIFOXYB2_FULL_49_7]
METTLIEKVEKPVNDTVAQANAIVVVDTETRLAAAEFLKVIKGMQKQVSDTFDPIVAKANAAWKEACNQRSKYLDPLKTAETALKNKAIAYDTEIERKAREEQARLEAKARTEEERKRKELEERARKAEAAGKAAKAEELRQKAEEVHVEAPTVQAPSVNVAGQSTREDWYAEVTDMMALVKAIADGKAPLTFIAPDMTVLNKQAKSMKNTWSYPGVAFKSRKVLSARA